MLEAINLECVRGERRLFHNLSFQLKTGECLLVRGENGSGKTSLLRMLVGLTPPALGAIRWQGREHLSVRTLSQGQKRRVSLARLLLQKRALWILDEPLTELDAQASLWVVIHRDLRLAMRRKSDVVIPLFFFAIVVSLFPLGILVPGKVTAYWLLTGLPLTLLAPILVLQFDLSTSLVLVLAASLAIGTPVLSFIGAIG